MDKKYEFLPHTADAKFRAYGRTLEEAVANAALAMVSLMWEPEKVELKVREEIEIKASSFPSLLVRFLTEILYLFEVRKFLLGRVEKIELLCSEKVGPEMEQNDNREDNNPVKDETSDAGSYVLKAILAGDRYSEKYEIISEVKAATYNEFSLKKGPDGYILQMVVDM